MNAHSTLWHSYTDDHIEQLIADVSSNSDHITLNTNKPTKCQTPHYNKHHHQISPRCYTLYNRTSWTTQHALSSDHLHIITTINIRHDYRLQQNRRTFTNYKKADWTQFTDGTESAFAQTTIPTTIHTANRIFTNIILMADKHNIPKCKIHSNCRLLPDHIVCKITQRNSIRRANTCDPALKLRNEGITSDKQNINKTLDAHKQNIWKENLDAHWAHRHNTHILWKTIHGLSNIAPPTTLNTTITLNNKIATLDSWTHIPHEHDLNTNIIPHIWKLANIVPIPKPNKDINNGTSYKPISLLSVIAKTLEKSLLPYITANTPNTSMQHDYKTQHSTVTALHTLNNTVAKGFNQMAPPARTITVALDMSNAFDTINIHTLIRKLLQTNIPGTIIKFIANYIKGRKAYTTYRNHTSKQRQFKTGVPKGGVLSHTLFNIYTSDLPPPSAPV